MVRTQLNSYRIRFTIRKIKGKFMLKPALLMRNSETTFMIIKPDFSLPGSKYIILPIIVIA